MSSSNQSPITVNRQQAAQAAAFLKGLASPHRLRILCKLVEGEACVNDLIAATKLPQTSVSQHLASLQRAKIITYRRAHRLRYYRLLHPLAACILAQLHQHFCAKNTPRKLMS